MLMSKTVVVFWILQYFEFDCNNKNTFWPQSYMQLLWRKALFPCAQGLYQTMTIHIVWLVLWPWCDFCLGWCCKIYPDKSAHAAILMTLSVCVLSVFISLLRSDCKPDSGPASVSPYRGMQLPAAPRYSGSFPRKSLGGRQSRAVRLTWRMYPASPVHWPSFGDVRPVGRRSLL